MNFQLIINMIFAFYLAWSIGSNNQTMGPVVGSGFRSLTIITLSGGIFYFFGANFAGRRVESTIGQGIIVGGISSLEALLIIVSITSWVTFASYNGWPTSTTHSTVGAAVGLGLVKFGYGGIYWRNLSLIIYAWAFSPLIGLIMGYTLTVIINRVLKTYSKGLIEIVKFSKLSAYTLFSLACLS